MDYPNSAAPVWFGQGLENDAILVKRWREAPITYTPEQPIDHFWNADRYEIILGTDSSGKLFQRAATLVLNNRFYPSSVMESVSDFTLEGRAVQPGDRVLQRILILQVAGQPILQVLTMNEITEVIDEPRKAGFTYTTTAAHSEVGEWSPSVEWRENNEVVLLIEVLSRSRPGASDFARRFTRQMQLRAHRLSIQNFLAQLNQTALPKPEPLPVPVAVPIAVGVAALGILLGFLIKRRK